jgi:hypothetical protein
MSAQPFYAWDTSWRDDCATILLVWPKRDGGWESKHSMVGSRYGEARGKQVSGMNLRRSASLIFPIHHTLGIGMSSFALSKKPVRSSSAGDDLFSLHTLFLPHPFLTRVVTIVQFLSRKEVSTCHKQNISFRSPSSTRVGMSISSALSRPSRHLQ